jgi:lipid-A-disaccharide synthase
MTARWEQKPIVIDPRDVDVDFARRMKRAAFRTADIALAASGTVSLELAANSTPMVIAYNMGWLSRQIIGRMLLTDTVTLVNLVSGDRSVPEFIGQNCRPHYIADALSKVLQKSANQDIAMDKTMQALGRDGIDPGQRAAKSVLGFLGP